MRVQVRELILNLSGMTSPLAFLLAEIYYFRAPSERWYIQASIRSGVPQVAMIAEMMKTINQNPAQVCAVVISLEELS